MQTPACLPRLVGEEARDGIARKKILLFRFNAMNPNWRIAFFDSEARPFEGYCVAEDKGMSITGRKKRPKRAGTKRKEPALRRVWIFDSKKLLPGDVVLERGSAAASRIIAVVTRGPFSRALIYVGGGRDVERCTVELEE